MPVIGIETLIYSVADLEECRRYFDDFGLVGAEPASDRAQYNLPDGSKVVLLPQGHPDLPSGGRIEGDGVSEVIWGVDSEEELARLAGGIGADRQLQRAADGTIRFVSDFGVPMGLRLFVKKAVVCAPDPLNAPGHVRRLNAHRKWRVRARPKGIAHVVFAIPDFEAGYRFMLERLGFRLSDAQRGFGWYLRAEGAGNHHNILLLNANAPLPDMDGKLRFHHVNFIVEDIDEIMVGANHMVRQGWEPSHLGLGRHRVDSALFYYLPCPAGGEAEYGADSDQLDDSWVPREWTNPLFGYASFVHNLPPFLMQEPEWDFRYITGIPPREAH